ncbi:hypothetical protein Pvag_pPag10077 (plasmid) [Pantoea vagans C9-1]|nr:hypothetical protein Pvag_pPag10077 [Pantoea vagans C9-1]
MPLSSEVNTSKHHAVSVKRRVILPVQLSAGL